MMREVTKSFLRFSWAMTVFGVDQLTNLVADRDDEDDEQHRVAKALDSVTQDTEKHFDKRAKSMYEAGDKVQSEFLDLMFDSAKPEEWNPKNMMDRVAKLADKSAEAFRDWTGDEADSEGDAVDSGPAN